MWAVERILGKCKGYVRTRSHPEGSIAEGYLFDECLTFCSRYLKGCETRFTRQARNVDVVENEMSNTIPYFCSKGRALGSGSVVSLDHISWLQAHRYVLFNHNKIEPYANKHLEHLSSIGLPNQKAIDNMHHEEFHEWFREHVLALVERGVEVSEEIQILAQEPLKIARKYNSYTIKGFNFHTHSNDEGRPIQNSGVAIAAENLGRTKIYYGIIREIVELDYRHKGNMVLFRCDWVDNRVQDKWVKTDKFGVTTVNFNHLFSSGDKLSDEPFILASQATQVYYVPEANDKGWCAVVQNKKPHDTYSMTALDDENKDDGHDNEGLLVDLHTGVDPNIDYAFVSHRKKQNTVSQTEAPTRQLRSSSRLNADTQTELESTHVQLDESEGMHESGLLTLHTNDLALLRTWSMFFGVPGQEREVRKITTMKSIWGRQNKPRLKVEINEIGQPCGKSGTRFANFIGTQIRTKGFPLAFDDLKKIDLPLKLGLWTDAKLFWDIDQGIFEWYMKTAQTKWKEFKADLKKDWYDESMDYHELISSCDDRVHPDQWKWLVDHWLTPEAKARSIRGKSNRAKHTQNHTAGSKSFARVDTEMTEELKRRPRRDEIFIRTHTHKSGVPQKGSVATIAKLQEEAGKHPELLEKIMKEGDLFAHVCGKEKNGYVRGVGLGPTPSDLELSGTRKYNSTKLQMKMEARRASDRRAEQMQQQMNDMQLQMAEMRQMFLSSQKQQEENNSTPRHGSHTPQQVKLHVKGLLEDEAESNASIQAVSRDEDPLSRRRNANVEKQQNIPQGAGRDVVVYSMTRPFNVPIAKGTLQTTDPKAMVGGEPLGHQCAEIVIHSVFKRDTQLSRPYGDVVTLGDARGKSIAWPTAMMKAGKSTNVPGITKHHR
ncbi:hypothetical protein ACQ4PT_045591 [Festuca glaucescens]